MGSYAHTKKTNKADMPQTLIFDKSVSSSLQMLARMSAIKHGQPTNHSPGILTLS
jgi:hypothetical protein